MDATTNLPKAPADTLVSAGAFVFGETARHGSLL